MKIVWISEKSLDVSVDHATWTCMVKQLNALGHQVLLVSGFRKIKNDFGLGDSIYYLWSIKKPFLGYISFAVSLFLFMIKVLWRQRPDLIIVHPFAILSLWPWLVLNKAGLFRTKFLLDIRTVPVEIAGIRGRIEEAEFSLSLHIARRFSDGMTVISPFMRQMISKRFKISEKSIGIWSSGVDEIIFDPVRFARRDIQTLRESLNIENKFVLMYHGVITPNRGLRETILALDKLDLPEVILIILGGGAGLPEMKKLVFSRGLESRVMFLPPVRYEDVPRYIATAHMGIIPLPKLNWWRVSSPIKMMEYLAMGKPVIVTDIEAHRAVLDDTPFTIFVPDADVDDLARGIRNAWERRAKFPKTISEARQLAQNSLSWKAQALKLHQYIREMRTGETNR